MKSPGLAAFLSFVLPGLGQLYAGRSARGAGVFVAATAAALFLPRLLGPAWALINFAAAWDAYRCAKEASGAAPAAPATEASAGLTYGWAAARFTLLLPVALLCALFVGQGLVGVSRLTPAVLPMFAVTVLPAYAAAAFGVWACWRELRLTTRVLGGQERVPAEAMAGWLKTAAVLGVVAGLGFAMVYPTFKNLFRYSAEAKIKGDLGRVRLAAQAYQRAHGAPPAALDALFPSEGLVQMPRLWPRFSKSAHEPTDEIESYSALESRDTGRWAYARGESVPDGWRIYIDCTHQDSRGAQWSSF